MGLTMQQQDRLRSLVQTLGELVGGGIHLTKCIALAIIGVGIGMLFWGLMTADPDTTTFRDFLLSVQSPQVHRLVFFTGCIFGFFMWVFSFLMGQRHVRYPTAAAVMVRSKAPEPKDGNTHE
jgi:hypothetical protein